MKRREHHGGANRDPTRSRSDRGIEHQRGRDRQIIHKMMLCSPQRIEAQFFGVNSEVERLVDQILRRATLARWPTATDQTVAKTDQRTASRERMLRRSSTSRACRE